MTAPLKALCYELLHEAQQSLRNENQLAPTAIVITPGENLIFDIEYEGEDERLDLYAEITDIALENNASAILTVNDVELEEHDLEAAASAGRREGSGGDGLDQPAAEAIMVTASGRDFETWSLVCPYYRRDQIMFQPAREKRDPGGELALLGDWTGRTGSA